jgi:hypothetical protein
MLRRRELTRFAINERHQFICRSRVAVAESLEDQRDFAHGAQPSRAVPDEQGANGVTSYGALVSTDAFIANSSAARSTRSVLPPQILAMSSSESPRFSNANVIFG